MQVHPFDVHYLLIYSLYSDILPQLCITFGFLVIGILIVNFEILTLEIRTLQSASEIDRYLGSW